MGDATWGEDTLGLPRAAVEALAIILGAVLDRNHERIVPLQLVVTRRFPIGAGNAAARAYMLRMLTSQMQLWQNGMHGEGV